MQYCPIYVSKAFPFYNASYKKTREHSFLEWPKLLVLTLWCLHTEVWLLTVRFCVVFFWEQEVLQKIESWLDHLFYSEPSTDLAFLVSQICSWETDILRGLSIEIALTRGSYCTTCKASQCLGNQRNLVNKMKEKEVTVPFCCLFTLVCMPQK